MQASRTQRSARPMRATRNLRASVALALLALVAQLVVPHLHRWQVAGHAASAAGDVHERAVASGAVVADVGDSAASHAESSCPICKALAASHDFLRATAQLAAPAANPIARIALLDAGTAHAPSGPHAARSPPHAG